MTAVSVDDLPAKLCQHLAIARRTAADGDLISISFDLDEPFADHWPATGDCFLLARPDSADRRLGLGAALVVESSGPGRFAALRAAHAGLCQAWRHDDAGAPGVRPFAFVGFAFADDGGDALPNARLTVPAVLLQHIAGRRSATFSCASRDADGAVDRWLALLATPADTRQPARMPIRVGHPLADRAWLARAGALVATIATGELDKAVLTRRTRLQVADGEIPVGDLLATLTKDYPNCLIYAVRHGRQVFAGATPERLVSLSDGAVSADALAGTTWTGPDGELSTPLSAAKNRHEQRLVADSVRAALEPLCANLDEPAEPEVMRLQGLTHLHSRVSGRLAPGVGLFDLVARLHPTPAVGGVPTADALSWLRRHGDARHGWYAGGIGWTDDHGNGEIDVALRCALIDGGGAELQAGAGIVAGSDPQRELAETEAKLGTMADAIRDACMAAATGRSRTA